MKCLWISLVLLGSQWTCALKPEEVEFFEAKIRPVLAQDCYECHRTGGKKKGGLALDWKGAMEEGGETDELFDFKNPAESFLIKVIRPEEEDLEMPKEGGEAGRAGGSRILSNGSGWEHRIRG